MQIDYRFEHDGRNTIEFRVDLDRVPEPRAGRGAWTALSCHQCPNCPLTAADATHCPAAVDLEDVVENFNEVMSYERVNVLVDTPHRTVQRECDAQSGVGALMGLIMANSACPILGRMKGLARTHLPFQTVEESISRFVGAYYLGQLLKQNKGEMPDWSLAGLSELFDDLTRINRAFKSRLESGAKEDAAMNAISAIAMQTLDVQYSLEDCAAELEQFAIGL